MVEFRHGNEKLLKLQLIKLNVSQIINRTTPTFSIQQIVLQYLTIVDKSANYSLITGSPVSHVRELRSVTGAFIVNLTLPWTVYVYVEYFVKIVRKKTLNSKKIIKQTSCYPDFSLLTIRQTIGLFLSMWTTAIGRWSRVVTRQIQII